MNWKTPLLACLLTAAAWCRPDFVLTPEEQEVIYPKGTFSAEIAKQLLGKGRCTLKGVAFDRQKSGLFEKKNPQQYPPAGSKIYLFPYTEYCQEVVALFKQYTPTESEHSMETLMAEARLKALTGKGLPELLPTKRVELDPQFSRIWKSATTDKQGRFIFENLKPGRYYLQSIPFMVARGYVYNEQVGEEVMQTYWSNGEVSSESLPIWAQRSSTVFRRIELVKVVEIGQEGEVQEIELDQIWDDF
jgi:hypothetical protein